MSLNRATWITIAAAGVLGAGLTVGGIAASDNGGDHRGDEGRNTAVDQATPPTADPWRSDQYNDVPMPWAGYDGGGDISNVHTCYPIDVRDLCYTVTNHSKWDLNYTMELTYLDASGARIATDSVLTYDVKPGMTDRNAEVGGGGALMPDEAATIVIDGVRVEGTQCSETDACADYEAPLHKVSPSTVE
jgi:hypothetical protein